MPTLVNVSCNEEKEEKEDKESFLSKVHEKLCSFYCSLKASKLFNMLYNESDYASDVVITVNDNNFNMSIWQIQKILYQ